jgi:glycosyltransferase involved in cell wall biosynthesis
MFIFFWFAHKLIFTNEFERGAVIKVCSCVENKSRVNKIFSNISKSKLDRKIGKRKYDIGYFGYIRHGKGIEEFLQVIEELKSKNNEIKAYVLGQRLEGLEEFADTVSKKSNEIGVEVIEGLPDNEVADILADTKVAFLPYPDGLSERRGSYLAYIRNLSLVVSTEGQFVTKSQRSTFSIVDVSNAPSELNRILSLPIKEQDVLQDKVATFVQTEIPSSWNDVVLQYNEYLEI